MADDLMRQDPLTALVIGALVGGLVGFVCFTRPGRRLLAQVDGTLDEGIDQMRRLQDAAVKVRRAVDEGRQTWYSVEQMADPPGTLRDRDRVRR